jgi:allantoinase
LIPLPRDFVGYGEDWPRFEWPNGKRLAVNVVVNFEEGAEKSPLDGDTTLDTLSEAPYPVPSGNRDLVQESIYEYGTRVAIWRLMRMFDRYRIPATIFAAGRAIERNPEVARAMANRGYDFVGHGYRWISAEGLTPEQELEEIEQARAAILAGTGQLIRGWFTRAPQSIHTRGIVARAGMLFDNAPLNDDVPYFQEVDGRPLLIVPYAIDVNDVRFWKGGLFTGGDFEEYLRDAFDVLRAESVETPRMLSIGLHARIVGRPGRVAGLERFLKYATQFNDVWFARRTDIAAFWAATFAPPRLWNWTHPPNTTEESV